MCRPSQVGAVAPREGLGRNRDRRDLWSACLGDPVCRAHRLGADLVRGTRAHGWDQSLFGRRPWTHLRMAVPAPVSAPSHPGGGAVFIRSARGCRRAICRLLRSPSELCPHEGQLAPAAPPARCPICAGDAIGTVVAYSHRCCPPSASGVPFRRQADGRGGALVIQAVSLGGHGRCKSPTSEPCGTTLMASRVAGDALSDRPHGSASDARRWTASPTGAAEMAETGSTSSSRLGVRAPNRAPL